MKQLGYIFAGIVVGFLLYHFLCNKVNIDEKVTNVEVITKTDTVYLEGKVDTVLDTLFIFKERIRTVYVRDSFPINSPTDSSAMYNYISLHEHNEKGDTIKVTDDIEVKHNRITKHIQTVDFNKDSLVNYVEVKIVDTVFINKETSTNTDIKRSRKFNLGMGVSVRGEQVIPSVAFKIKRNQFQVGYTVKTKTFNLNYIRYLW